MSKLKSILNLFVTTTGNETPVEINKNESSSVAVSKPIIQNEIKSNDKILKVLEEALKENNQEGFDYFEFRTAMKTMSNSIPDEMTRFNAALATSISMNVDVLTLIESAKYYIKILNDEGKKFEEDLNAELKNMDNLIKENLTIEKEIKDKSDLIKKLTDEISASQIKKKNNEDELGKNESSIENAKQQFDSVRNQLISEIKNDISKLNTQIKGGKKNGSSRKN